MSYVVDLLVDNMVELVKVDNVEMDTYSLALDNNTVQVDCSIME